MGQKIIIASDSDTGSFEFAHKAVDIFKILHPRASVVVIDTEQIFKDFINNGYTDPDCPEAAKALLKLRESFPHRSYFSPTHSSVFRAIRDAGEVDLLIVTEVRDFNLVDMLRAQFDFGSAYFLRGGLEFRTEQFHRKFRVDGDQDIPQYLTCYIADKQSGEQMTNIDVDSDEDVLGAVLKFVGELILPLSPPKGSSGSSLASKVEETAV